MKKIYCIILLISSVFSLSEITFDDRTFMLNNNLNANPEDLFELFIKIYNKPYTFQSTEGKLRFNIFKQTLEYILKSRENKDKSYDLGLNSFSDLTHEEIKNRYLDFNILQYLQNLKKEIRTEINYFLKETSSPKFSPIDWRDQDLFNNVRDQGDCGACWAFAVTGSMEAHFSIKSGMKNEYLSVQQLVDCDTKEKGCKGGWPSIAYNYIQKNGLVSDENYPYEAKTNTCKSDIVSSSNKYMISKFNSCEEDECNNNNFFNSLLQKGPFAVVIDAYNTEFFNYKSGIYNQSCAEPNHAIILVGYGKEEETGEDYWIIRNSWSNSWGMNGYGYVKNDINNYYSCNINRYAFQPEVKISNY